MVDAYMYFFHIDKAFNIPTTPDSIQTSAQVSFAQEAILGRSAPQVTFSSAGPTTQSLTLTLHRQMMALDNPDLVSTIKDENGNDIDVLDQFINALASATLPKYDSSYKAIIPPSVLCRFGSEVKIEGVLSDGLTQTSSGVWLKNGKLSTVQVTFTILEVGGYSAEYAFQNGFFRGLSSDLRRSSIWTY